MNEVFLIGKTTEKVEYKFIVNKKTKFAKAYLKIKTLDKQSINLICYNDIADFCLRKIKINDLIMINGKFRTNMEIEITALQIL